MSETERAIYFDSIADAWDGWEDAAVVARKLADGLTDLDIRGDRCVLDVGCGTGNLTAALLARLGPAGRVVAIDIAPRMLAVAKGKVVDPRVEWHLASATHLPLAAASCDEVLCYSVWPHFPDPTAAARELARVLRPGGRLHVWHLLGRARINEIHASAGAAVRGDVLAPASATAALLVEQGLAIDRCTEDERHYLVTARKLAR